MNKRLRPKSLMELPVVFSVRELKMMGYEGFLSKTLERMAKEGLVKRLGYGLFLNMFKKDDLIMEDVARRYLPFPIVAGCTVLHEAGVIDQIPRELDVICIARSAPSIEGIHVSLRSKRWLAAIKQRGELIPGSDRHLPRLTPQAAWREMLAEGRTFGLHEDDLDWDAMDLGGI